MTAEIKARQLKKPGQRPPTSMVYASAVIRGSLHNCGKRIISALPIAMPAQEPGNGL